MTTPEYKNNTIGVPLTKILIGNLPKKMDRLIGTMPQHFAVDRQPNHVFRAGVDFESDDLINPLTKRCHRRSTSNTTCPDV